MQDTTTTLPPGPPLPLWTQTLLWLVQPVRFPAWCRRYGDPITIRLAQSPTLVVTGRPDLAREIIALPPEVATAAEENAVLEPLLGPRSVLMLDGPDHVRLRRLLSPFLRGESMRQHREAIADLTRREVASWPRGAPFPLLPRMRSLTLDVILRVVFGLEESPRLTELRQELERLLAAGSSWLVPLWTRRDFPGSPWTRFIRMKHRVDAMLMAEVERLAGHAGGGVLPHLQQAREAGELSEADVRDQLITLLVAGHETTATSLSWCFDLLLHRPDLMERIRQEAEGSERLLEAVIRETLRLRPIFRLISRRLQAPVELGGWRLPAGVGVGANVYFVHRDPALFPDPEAFRPERHLTPNGAEGEAAQAWLPFGGGIRRCLGAAFAQFEMGVVLRTVLEEARLRPAGPAPEPISLHAVMLVPRHGARAVVLPD